MMQKDSNYKVRDCPTIASILNENMNQHTTSMPSLDEITSDKLNIEKADFDLVQKQVAYDRKTYEVWRRKMMNYTTAMSHNKDVWPQNVILNNKKVVDEFLRNKVRFEVLVRAVCIVAVQPGLCPGGRRTTASIWSNMRTKRFLN